MRRRVAMRKVAAATMALLSTLFFIAGPSPEATAIRPATVQRAGGEAAANTNGGEAGGGEAGGESAVGSGSGALGLATGEVAVAIQQPLAPLPLEPGDIIELVAVVADDHRGASASRLGQARVLALDDRSVTVAVAAASALTLVEFRAIGTIEAVLTPGGSRAPSP